MAINSTCPIPAGAADYGTHGTAHKYMLFVSAGCTIAVLLIALSLIILHLRRYRAPKEQRQIIRIVFSVVVYCLVSFFEIFQYEIAQYIDPIGDVYESFGLCALYLLFVQYAVPSGTFSDETFEAVKAAEEQETTFDWPRISWTMVFQYPVIEILAILIQETTEAVNHYCSQSLSPQYGHIWVQVLSSISIGPCVFAILAFRGHMKKRMNVRRGLSKLLAFKVIVFIRFTQAWAFSLLLEYKVIKVSSALSYNDILWGIPAMATSIEMVLFSLGFWYAFSASEYSSTTHHIQRPLPLWRAILDALNPTDLFLGIARVIPLCVELKRNGAWGKYRQAQKNAGVAGAARRGAAKLKNRFSKNDQGTGRYQEIDAGAEPLNKPVEMHHTRSGSNISQVDTAYAPFGGVGGQEMYLPPSGSPPDEATSHLMAESQLGRSSSPSHGEWDGQRYSRTPSPHGRFTEAAMEGRDMV